MADDDSVTGLEDEGILDHIFWRADLRSRILL